MLLCCALSLVMSRMTLMTGDDDDDEVGVARVDEDVVYTYKNGFCGNGDAWKCFRRRTSASLSLSLSGFSFLRGKPELMHV